MDTELYYFSGTGNSLLVARELATRIPGACLVPIVQCLEHRNVRARGRAVGLVFPVHALTIPIVVRRFVERLDVGPADYLFAVATRGAGTVFRGFEKLDRLLGRQCRRLDAAFIVEMYNTDSRHGRYRVPTEAELLAIAAAVRQRADRIADTVLRRATSREKDLGVTTPTSDNPRLAFLLEVMILLAMDLADLVGGANYFYHDERCSGCGTCAKVCLSRKIALRDGKPVWSRRRLCTMCFACLNFCPRESVQIRSIPGVKSFSVENGRYPHPYATVRDIAAQKGG